MCYIHVYSIDMSYMHVYSIDMSYMHVYSINMSYIHVYSINMSYIHVYSYRHELYACVLNRHELYTRVLNWYELYERVLNRHELYTRVPNRHELYTTMYMFLVIYIFNNLTYLFHNSSDCVMNSRVSGQCSHAIAVYLCVFYVPVRGSTLNWCGPSAMPKFNILKCNSVSCVTWILEYIYWYVSMIPLTTDYII